MAGRVLLALTLALSVIASPIANFRGSDASIVDLKDREACFGSSCVLVMAKSRLQFSRRDEPMETLKLKPQRANLARRGLGKYAVVSGVTGNSISAAYSITFSTLSSANPGVNWNNLQIGQQLQMPSLRSPIKYSVVSGDTGYAISSKYNIYFNDLSAANPLVNWNNLQIGQNLLIPTYGVPSQYTIASGDSVDTLAQAHGITVSNLQSANPDVNLNNLQIGKVIIIPASVSPSTGSLPSPAATTISTTSAALFITTTRPLSTFLTSTASTRSTSIIPINVLSSRTTSATSSTRPSLCSGVGLNPSSKTTSTTLMAAATTTTPSTRPMSSSSPSTLILVATLSSTTATSRLSSILSSSTTLSSSVSTTGATTISSSVTSGFATTTSGSSSMTITTTAAPNTTTLPSASSSGTSTTASSSGSSGPAITNTAVVTGANYIAAVKNSDGVGALPDRYVFYQGSGSTADGWPSMSSWVSFSDMWNAYLPYIGQNCVGGVKANTPSETQSVYDAIQAVAAASGVDHRFIFAVIMQESTGCVRVPTTYGYVANPGLMQSFNGAGTCYMNGVAQNPCPASQIYQMVEDGSMGTLGGTGPGLVQDINSSGAVGTLAYYKAARIYNSGSVPTNGDLGGPGATRCYVSDIANRLTGWVVAKRTCTLDG